jgi:hypothetical protein
VTRRTWPAVVLCLAGALSDPDVVRADAGAWQLDAGLGYRGVSADDQGMVHALVGLVGLHRWLDEAFLVGLSLELGGGVARSDEPGAEPDDRPGGSALALGGGPFSRGELTLRWALDAFTWVPFIELGAGLLVRDRVAVEGDLVTVTTGLEPTLSASLGADWRPARAWSLGARVGGGSLPLTSGWLGRADLCATWHFED